MIVSHRIAIADDNPETLEFIETALEQLGHKVVSKSKNGNELVEQCREVRPDLVITDIRMPDMDGLRAAAELCRFHSVPVILVSAFVNPEYIEAALQNYVLAYLVKPIRKADLAPVIGLVMQRHKEFQALRQQLLDLRQALRDRKVIEQAKGILMKQAGFDEPDAHRRLQLLSSQKNKKMAHVARIIVRGGESTT